MSLKVCKFGGSSLCNAEQFKKVKAIMLADPTRRYIVVSAPGKRFSGDEKITDMLYKLFGAAERKQPYDDIFEKIAERYREIVRDLELNIDIEALLSETKAQIIERLTPDFAASRGEYLNARLMAAYLGWDFIDASEFVHFDTRGHFIPDWTNEALAEIMTRHEYAVIPGFYGAYPNGEIHTFTRGGSDITGAIVARAAKAELYENWTDVCGFMMADPRIVENPRCIREVTYQELRELSYMGATVLHEEAIFPVRKAGIPTNIRCTNVPDDPGTMIISSASPAKRNTPSITGIAGHKHFSIITIDKAMMNSEYGFGRRVLEVLEDFHISFEHLPTGIDTMSVVVAEKELTGHVDEIIERIQELCQPDSIVINGGIALIATVGHGMVRMPGSAAKLFTALYNAGVNIRMIDQGSSELNIIVGVNVEDFEKATRAIYNAFVND